MDQIKGLLDASSEREFITIVLAAAVSGVFTFALAWRILGTSRDVTMRQMDSLDKAVARTEHDDTEQP